MDKLIIIGGNNYNTLGCVRCFGQKQIPFTLLLVKGQKDAMILKSKLLKTYVLVDNVEDAIVWLKNHRAYTQGTVVIPTSDRAESALDNNLDELITYYCFPHALAQGDVSRMMNKDVQVAMAHNSGLDVPETFVFNRGDELPTSITYPVIVKQENSTKGRKREMHICHNKEELHVAINSLKDTKELLIQQYIKREYELLIIGCRLSDGSVWLPAIFKKTRWMLNGGDGSYGLISTKVSQYFHKLEQVKQLLASMNYYGPFSIEFGIVKDKAYFYEVNMRNDGTSHYFYPAGIYVPLVYYKDCLHQLNESDTNVEELEYKFIDELGDMCNLFHGLSLWKWIVDIYKAKVYKYYFKGDNAPFWNTAPRSIAHSIYRIICR